MKTKMLVALLAMAAVVAVAQDQTKKLWVSIQSQYSNDRVIFIQDRETGTRCYAITNDKLNAAGYAISCVPASSGGR